MNSLRAVKRLQGAVPRMLLGNVPHSTTSLIEDGLGGAVATLIDAPTVPCMFNNKTRTLTSAALAQEERWEASDRQEAEEFNAIAEQATEEPVLKLPETLEEIGRLNPELREAMEAHASFTREKSVRNARQQVEALLQEANGGKAVNPTKTALNKLKIDKLRAQLDALGADTRGNKVALVSRLLDLVNSSESADSSAAAAATIAKEGLVSRKALHRAAQVRAREGLEAQDFVISDAELQEETAAMVAGGAQFTRAFSSPHEVARLLVDARAEDITIMDVRGACTFTDYMVLATGRSPQLVHMLAGAVLHELKARCKEVAPGVSPGVEGAEDPNARWLVVDAGSVVVHVFSGAARKEYDLEGLWGSKRNMTRVAPKATINTIDTLQA